MNKVLINYNAKDNFGDDLLVKIICGRFPGIQFSALVPKGLGKGLENVKNLKITGITPRNAARLYKKAVSKADACIYAGGRVFIESFRDMGEFWEFRELLNTKPLYYINPDFGPYMSEDFLSEAREHIAGCGGIWFRDRHSYSMFDGKNVHYMPPLSFAADFPEPIKTSKPYAVISPVDLTGRPELSMLYDRYMSLMRHTARLLRGKGFDVIILPLCAHEWDDRAAQELSDCGTVVPYTGDADSILSIISGAKCVIGSRFHAIICAIAAGVSVVPVYYAENLPHAVGDLDNKIACFDIKNLDSLTDEVLEKAMTYKTAVDAAKIKKNINRELDTFSDIIYKNN